MDTSVAYNIRKAASDILVGKKLWFISILVIFGACGCTNRRPIANADKHGFDVSAMESANETEVAAQHLQESLDLLRRDLAVCSELFAEMLRSGTTHQDIISNIKDLHHAVEEITLRAEAFIKDNSEDLSCGTIERIRAINKEIIEIDAALWGNVASR